MIVRGMLKTLAFHHSAQGKSDRMSELSVQRACATATLRQEAAHDHPRAVENLGFSSFRPRKVGQDVRAFRETRN